MSPAVTVADQAVRERALEPATSFIVQAPAGSGKTGLLTQRFLVLLARVESPEEIIAITFTRKAAAEMRQRIIEALQEAQAGREAEDDYRKATWQLARRALQRDRQQGWQLLANPGRLRIQTIDSLNASLARQMPVLTRLGATPAVVEDARPLYLEAATLTLEQMEESTDWSDDVSHLVQHLDNQLPLLKQLIASMLARRDQWLRHVADRQHPRLERRNIEAALSRIIETHLTRLEQAVPADCRQALVELARYAAANLRHEATPQARALSACLDLVAMPDARVASLAIWKGFRALLLSDGGWRKQLDKRQGFPAPSAAQNAEEKALFGAMKTRMTTLLGRLAEEAALQAALFELDSLPAPGYSDEQWRTLEALFEMLKLAAGQLQLLFNERRQVDFPGLSQSAIMALGDSEQPTDLALALDYRIQHLLLDEFQDTSFNQYELLNRLTAGWQAGDGRTLFVVGDPMQSIYRFREAEVGLFLQARDRGVGQVALDALRLEVNFRSRQGIVDWVNDAFPHILPQQEDVSRGAVSYAPSLASKPAGEDQAVTVHPFFQRDDVAEAQRVRQLVLAARQRHPDGSTAILVRSRAHLAHIVVQLRHAGLRFRAVEIEALSHRPVIQDLLALTRALHDIGDRISWLAVLRSPWCGLSLADLHTLVAEDRDRPVLSLLGDTSRLDGLSADGRQRLVRVLPWLRRAVDERQRHSLRHFVQSSWLVMGGPACVESETDLQDAEVFFQLLESLQPASEGLDMQALAEQVESLFALPDVAADESLQLMTIHKSKGLEFDTVILPGLGREPRHEESRLLYWMEVQQATGQTDLLLAPIAGRGEDKNSIAAYIDAQNRLKGRYEDGRLLYVAATRARQFLHLLGHVGLNEKGDVVSLKPPPASTLLAALWPVVEKDFLSAQPDSLPTAAAAPDAPVPLRSPLPRQRLGAGWQLPAPPATVLCAADREEAEQDAGLEFSWASETARHVGTVVHRLLQEIGQQGLCGAQTPDIQGYADPAGLLLRQQGVPQAHLTAARQQVLQALGNVLADETGRWILSAEHDEAHCELAISGLIEGRVCHLIIDRTFVDADGVRWVIDYKTGSHAGGGVEAFLDREQERYRPQLERYGRLMRQRESRPVRLALYFPLLKRFREVGHLD